MTTEELLALHEATSAKCRDIMRRKNNDYTGGQGTDDPFANFNMSSAFGVHPALGVVLRIGDKLQRIRSFANDGALQVSGETIDDACEDIVNYAIIIKGIFRAEAAQRNAEAFKDLYGGPVQRSSEKLFTFSSGGWCNSLPQFGEGLQGEAKEPNPNWSDPATALQLAAHIASLEELGREAGRRAEEDYNKAKEDHYRQIYLDLAASKAAAATSACAASLCVPDHEPDDYGHHAAAAPTEPPAPPYRMLEVGEITQEGDEYQSRATGGWFKTGVPGLQVGDASDLKYRRLKHV